MEKTIVSLTSHGIRLKYVAKTIYSILRQCKLKVVLTLYKDDLKNITPELKKLIDSGYVELIKSDVDLGPHLKYYWAMKQHKDYNVITIDDDCLYSDDFISSLLDYHKKYPDAVISRRAHLMTFTDGKLDPYNFWKKCIKHSDDHRHILATGVGGILYPANVLDIDSVVVEELKKCFFADDIYLKVLENRRNIKIVIIPTIENHPKEQVQQEIKSIALHKQNVGNSRNDKYIKEFLDWLV